MGRVGIETDTYEVFSAARKIGVTGDDMEGDVRCKEAIVNMIKRNCYFEMKQKESYKRSTIHHYTNITPNFVKALAF